MHILKIVLAGFLIPTLALASYLGDPVVVKSGGTGLSTVPSAGQILVGNAGGTAYALVLMSSDATMAASGAITIANLAITNAKIANATIDLTAKVTGILPNANTTAASANTASAIVARDGSGNFSAGTITAALTGNATGLSGTPALPNGTTATTQAAADNSTKIATTAYADRMLPLAGGTMTGQLVTKGVTETVVADGTCSTSFNINPTLGTVHTLTLSGACAIGVTSLAAGHSFTIYLTQSSTTAPTFTSAYKWATATVPTFSTSATKFDTIACGSPDGTKVICGAIIDAR